MLRLLTAFGTVLSLVTFIATGSETRSSTKQYRNVRWPVAVKAHDQFDNWT
jgi:hypothetical protein